MAEINSLEELIKAKNKKLFELTRIILPEMFTSARTSSITLEAQGNLPAMEATRKPYFKAGISSEWEESKRQAAFAYLRSIDAGGLIRATITSLFGPKTEGEQRKLLSFLSKLKKVEYEASESVPWNTLTSWLRAEVERGSVPKLELIGGDIGQVVKLKEIKE